ncbi:MAG: Yip1 family protein [Candidatus Aquicultor sp.]
MKNVAGILLSPSQTFERIRERPTWLIPVVLLVITSVLLVVVSAPLSLELAKQQLTENAKQMSPEQVAQTEKMLDSPLAKGISIISTLFITILGLLVQAGLLHLAASALGGVAGFRMGWATVVYAQAPIIIQQIVHSLYTAANKTLVKPGLSALLPADNLISPMGTFLSRIDIFIVWSLVLVAIGFSITYKMSKGKAIAMSAGYWLLGTIVLTLITAITSGLRPS